MDVDLSTIGNAFSLANFVTLGTLFVAVIGLVALLRMRLLRFGVCAVIVVLIATQTTYLPALSG